MESNIKHKRLFSDCECTVHYSDSPHHEKIDKLEKETRIRRKRKCSFTLTLVTIGVCLVIGGFGILLSTYFHADMWTALWKNWKSYCHDEVTTNSSVHASVTASCGSLPPAAQRFDCYPWTVGASQAKCEARGCCWAPVEGQLEQQVGDTPYCVYPPNYVSYNVKSVAKTGTGMNVKLGISTPSHFKEDIANVQLDIEYSSATTLRFKFFDPSNERYEVPIKTSLPTAPVTEEDTDYVVSVPSQGPFSITVTRKSTGAVMFGTEKMAPLIFANQYLQIASKLSSPYIYGLGEHRNNLLIDIKWTKMAMWARDQPPSLNNNLYGVHPFYLNIEQDDQAHGVFLLNSNAMEIELQEAPAITYRTIGGVLDFYLFTGPNPVSVVEQYTQLIGHSFMPPYWGLGFHLCRWGYGGAQGMKEVIDRNRAANMPYDTQWNDIDYMKDHLDWTYDADGLFHDLPDVVKDLHDHGQHYIMIEDCGISSTQSPGSYPPYDDGLKLGTFVMKPDGSGPIIGLVWPGKTAYPDFTHPNATSYWTQQAQIYHDQVPFDGLWMDMNEPSDFVAGSVEGCPDNQWENPEFIPEDLDGGALKDKTLCASAKQHLSLHYNLHSLYGHMEATASTRALESVRPNKRSVVITRSTFPSSGTIAGHWLGDNNAQWEDLFYSIPGVMNFQLFGIPLVGADICGFNGDTNPELCARWNQLGAFYPFMRNHNTKGNKDQDPASFDTDTQNVIRTALTTRYTLLPYLYSMFYRSHVDGTPIVRPLFFQYPNSDTYKEDVQFMWGSGLLITPAVLPNIRQAKHYLPKDRWYDYNSWQMTDAAGGFINFDLPYEHINIQVRGGSIIPQQQADVTTTAARKHKFELLVALAPDTSAYGELYWDDGEDAGAIKDNKYNLIKFTSIKDMLFNEVVKSGYTGEPMTLGQATIMGVMVAPTTLTVNGAATTSYKYVNQTIALFDQSINMLEPFKIVWTT